MRIRGTGAEQPLEGHAPMKPLLITGGAGYIGRHNVLAFADAGYPVVVLDDLSAGDRASLPEGVAFVEGGIGNREAVGRIIAEHGIAAVVHMAARISVPESVADPLLYYRNNSGASADLIRACVDGGVKRFVFSSTAAVYGEPSEMPVPEHAPTVPVNPYGISKLVTEWALRDTAAAHDLRYVTLRYFNVAGADPAGRAGPSGGGAHLINAACEAALGRRGPLTVFGSDYPTADGTCVRDYIHVTDLADAHVLALRALEAGGGSRTLNCGYGRGFSVREVIAAVEAETGGPLPVREGPRRPGDPAALVADAKRIREEFRWTPRHDDLRLMVASVLRWFRQPGAGRD